MPTDDPARRPTGAGRPEATPAPRGGDPGRPVPRGDRPAGEHGRPAGEHGRPAGEHGRPAAWTGGEPGHAAGTLVPSPHRRAPARFSLLGIALLGGSAVIALTVTFTVFLPALGALGAPASPDPAALPDRISVCGRDWTKDPLGRTFTRDEIQLRTEAEPIVVSTGTSAACPPEVGAPGSDADGMATVVYVRTGDDAFVPYELVGEP